MINEKRQRARNMAGGYKIAKNLNLEGIGLVIL